MTRRFRSTFRPDGLNLARHASNEETMNRYPALLATLSTLLCLSAAGCEKKEVVRGTQDPSIDLNAMSTGLDKDDIGRMLMDNLNNLRSSPIMNEWRAAGGRMTVSVFPFINQTSEHIEPQLDAILSETETWLVDAGTVTVISRERQNQMIWEVEGHRNAVFNPAHIARYGQQLGVKYYVTGKVQTSDERTEDSRRVQYFFYMQVIEVSTSAIRWQHKSYVTKMIR
jgi:penicillin-binding protein activator